MLLLRHILKSEMKRNEARHLELLIAYALWNQRSALESESSSPNAFVRGSSAVRERTQAPKTLESKQVTRLPASNNLVHSTIHPSAAKNISPQSKLSAGATRNY